MDAVGHYREHSPKLWEGRGRSSKADGKKTNPFSLLRQMTIARLSGENSGKAEGSCQPKFLDLMKGGTCIKKGDFEDWEISREG